MDRIKNSPNYHWHVLATVSIGTFMATLDASIVNVALPTIAKQFSASLSMIQWVVTAYLLTTSSLMAVFGRIADILGRKKVYTLGFLVFTLGSLLCGLSQGFWFLVGMRIVQAVGAAMLTANSAAIVTATAPPRVRGRALGFIGTVVALGTMAGPSIGGLLVGFTSWHFIFLINIPLGITGFFLGRLILPADEPNKDKEKFDFPGAVLFCAGIVSLLFGINNGENWGWSSPAVYLNLIMGIILLISFVLTEKKVKHPLIDLSLFRNRPFLMGNLSGWMCFMAIFTYIMLFPFYLQQILNYTPSQVGLLMTVFPITMMIVAPLSGSASDKFGPLALTTSGLVIAGAGFFYCSTFSAETQFYQIIPALMILGLGAGMFQSPNNSSVMSSVPPKKLGISGSIASVVRHVGMVSGTAMAVTLFDMWGGVTIPRPEQKPVFMHAFHLVMLTAMAIAFTAAIISFNRRSYAKAEVTN